MRRARGLTTCIPQFKSFPRWGSQILENQNFDFNVSCCNPKAQVVPSDVHSYRYDVIFRTARCMKFKAQKLADIPTSATTQPRNAPEAAKHTVVAPALPARDFQHLHVNVSFNYQGLRARIFLTTSDGSMLEHVITLSF
ncbi:hypothetical protein PS1_012545 [Malus domestica]